MIKAEVSSAGLFETSILKLNCAGAFSPEKDLLAVEEPLEIRIGTTQGGNYSHRAVSITMRTPGDDFELAAGFLFTEGIIDSSAQVAKIDYCGDPGKPQNTVKVDLKPGHLPNIKSLERNFYTTSSCGVCGKTSIEALSTGACAIENPAIPAFSPEEICFLPQKLRDTQAIFDKTGGLHAAALFDVSGQLIRHREDVGRHNAVDKLIGAFFLQNQMVLKETLLFLSGRASFELVQKAAMAKIPIVAAVGAPSSLAVETAKAFNITLLGFVRENRFNIYSGEKRISNEIKA